MVLSFRQQLQAHLQHTKCAHSEDAVYNSIGNNALENFHDGMPLDSLLFTWPAAFIKRKTVAHSLT